MIYRLVNFGNGTLNTSVIYCVTNGYTIPTTDPANTDYANFKKQILADKAQLQDAEGVIMADAEAKAYVATLP